ncbi:MAG: spore germination protein [Oscillospiraceae bacterium]|nr:spore germination protein [Oscillospiraceae bacterium]
MQPYTPQQKPKYAVPLTDDAVAAIFRDAADFTSREIFVGGRKLTLFFLDGLTSGSEIALQVLRPLAELPPMPQRKLLSACLHGAVYNATAEQCTDVDAVCRKLVNGCCVLVFPELHTAVSFETKTGEKRAPAPPDVESTVKGAKDAFTETLRTNTSLVRRHLRLPELQITQTTVGRKSGTTVAVISVRGLTDPALIKEIQTRLDALDIDGMVTPAAAEEYLTGSRKTAFPMVQFTERPDRFAQSLLDGQVGVLIDGLPLGYLLPVNVGLLLTAAEDRGSGYVLASCVRVVRYLALLTSLLLPALYIAMAEFHPAMIPTKLLSAIIESKQNVPFSTVAEVLGLLISFELLQEAGLHLPKSVGHTVSIVGGLVVGSAAVDAKLISPAALIVASVAGICGYAVPEQDFSGAIRVWRFVLSVCAALAGLYGVTVGMLVLLVHLGELDSCGKPYLAPFSAITADGAMLRRRLVTQKFRNPFLHPQDRRNQR